MNEEEFKARAKAYIEKSKAKGVSNIAIYNTIKIKYGEYLADKTADREQAQEDKEAPELETDSAGNKMQWNPTTQQWETVTAVDPNVNNPASQFDTGNETMSSSQPIPVGQTAVANQNMSSIPNFSQGLSENTEQQNLDEYSNLGAIRSIPKIAGQVGNFMGNTFKSNVKSGANFLLGDKSPFWIK